MTTEKDNLKNAAAGAESGAEGAGNEAAANNKPAAKKAKGEEEGENSPERTFVKLRDKGTTFHDGNAGLTVSGDKVLEVTKLTPKINEAINKKTLIKCTESEWRASVKKHEALLAESSAAEKASKARPQL